MTNFLNLISLTLCKSMTLFLGNDMLKDLGVKSHDVCVLLSNGSEKMCIYNCIHSDKANETKR